MNAGAAAPTFLPILTFDENRLSPSFGYVFDRRWLEPYESIVSILWKFVRINALAGHVVASAVGCQAVDPYDGTEAHREAIDIARLKKMLGISRSVLREALVPAARHGAVSPSFRYCPGCLGRGYHAVVHQFESVGRCPIHEVRLETACRRCGHVAPYRLNVRLLEAPYRCPECRSIYGTHWPNVPGRFRMPMKEVIPMTRTRIARCWY